MSKASDNVFPRLLISEGGSTATPAAARVTIYAKADGLLYSKDDAGAETALGGGAGGDVATDAIWDAAGDLAVGTGADTAAKLTKGAAGGVLAMGNSAVIWNAGTSFPASKATGDRYFRTDLGMECYWDGTRWVTSQLFYQPAIHTGAALSATVSFGTFPLWRPTYAPYIYNFRVGGWIGATNDGSKYWTFELRNASNDAVIVSANTTADSANAGIGKAVAVNATTTEKHLYAYAVKTSTPTNISVYAAIEYRLIVT